MNKFHIKSVIKDKNRISYRYEIEGDWKKYFNQDILFWSEYDHSMEHIPNSVAVLPLLGNIIVMASIFHAEIYLDEIDKDFYNSIENFLEGYQTMSPHIDFKKQQLVFAKKTIDNASKSQNLHSMLFFSGGVDAWSSLITHMEEKPQLISIWGADIPFDNEKAWKKTKTNHQEIADEYQLDFLSIRSTLRRFINEKALNDFTMDIVKDNWWSAFQHSVGMMCLAAPYTEGRISSLYFASTYSEMDEESEHIIASDPLIDNKVAFAGCRVFHDGYNFSRHDKVTRICRYAKTTGQPINIRVCFKSTTGDNCCRCEKCSNTILSMLVEGFHPEDFGFQYEKTMAPVYISSGMQEMAKEEKYSFLSIYTQIQSAYRKKYDLKNVPDELKLFYLADIHHLTDFLHAPCNICSAKEEKIHYLDDLIREKVWLEQQYHILTNKLRDVEQDWAIKNQWIAKLDEDIIWLKDKNNGLNMEIDRLQTLNKRPMIQKVLDHLKRSFKKSKQQGEYS